MRTAFRGGQVFDGTGADPAAADVVVEDGRIVEVGPGLDADTEVDCTGQTLLPGFFDCHVHVMVTHIDLWRKVQQPFSYPFFEATRNLARTLAAGVTSVRDAGGADLGLKQAVSDGLVAGPRMQIAVGAISQTGGHGDGWLPSGDVLHLMHPHPGMPPTVVDGPDSVRHVVRSLIRAGAEVIKVHTSGGVLSPRDSWRHAQFQPDELDVVVAEANAVGIAVMAHAQAGAGIKNAVRAGFRSIEHGIDLDDEAVDR
ncbi:MAG: amidohydrolase family protein, partial [Mycobacteriales bacterium]